MAFTLATFEFLDQLTLHNEREWFEAHKQDYEALVREPALAFIRAMREPLAAIAPSFLADDKKVGGSLMRVHRDTRFASDKTPYKTNVGIQFRHAGGKDVHAPGWYVHVSPDECFIGLGSWRPEPPQLLAIRQKIAAEGDRFAALVAPKTLAKKGLSGAMSDALKRVPKGFPADHPHAEHLKLTSFVLSADIAAKDVTSKTFPAFVAKRFAGGVDYMRFLCEAVGVSL